MLPAVAGAVVDDVVARFDHGITDVQVGPDDSLYVATSNAIWTIWRNWNRAIRASR